MSLFDDVRILDDHAALFPCAAGHPQRAFQTQDINDPIQATYYLKGRKLYMADSTLRTRGIRFVDRADSELESRVEERTLFMTTRTLRTASLASHTGVAHIYTHCTTCRTIVYMAPTLGAIRNRMRRELQEVSPAVEYKVKLVAGELVKCKATMLETREKVAHDLRTRGLRVLEDDEHMARRHRGELDEKELRNERDQDW